MVFYVFAIEILLLIYLQAAYHSYHSRHDYKLQAYFCLNQVYQQATGIRKVFLASVSITPTYYTVHNVCIFNLILVF
jgi:hypothetical protein